MEVIATKAYHPSGVVTVTIIYDVSANNPSWSFVCLTVVLLASVHGVRHCDELFR